MSNELAARGFLNDGRMLVTERTGKLGIVQKDGTMSKPLSGVPKVFAEGQGDCSMFQSTLPCPMRLASNQLDRPGGA